MPLGAELLNVYFISAKPTPEVAKALEADYRETLLRKADMAIYARRAAAVEEERKIKENELNTEIALEEQRRRLIDLQGRERAPRGRRAAARPSRKRRDIAPAPSRSSCRSTPRSSLARSWRWP